MQRRLWLRHRRRRRWTSERRSLRQRWRRQRRRMQGRLRWRQRRLEAESFGVAVVVAEAAAEVTSTAVDAASAATATAASESKLTHMQQRDVQLQLGMPKLLVHPHVTQWHAPHRCIYLVEQVRQGRFTSKQHRVAKQTCAAEADCGTFSPGSVVVAWQLIGPARHDGCSACRYMQ